MVDQDSTLILTSTLNKIENGDNLYYFPIVLIIGFTLSMLLCSTQSDDFGNPGKLHNYKTQIMTLYMLYIIIFILSYIFYFRGAISCHS